MAAKVKKGDTVIVTAGRDKALEGTVLAVFPKDNRVLVSGVNKVKRHTKPSQTGKGGIIEKEAAIHVSNVALKDPSTGKPTRVGFRLNDDGKKVRVAKRSGEIIGEVTDG